MKRQLSEKDIIIGPNGQVKRKRFRRNKNATFISGAGVNGGQTASKTAAVVPARPDAKDWVGRNSITPTNSTSNLGNESVPVYFLFRLCLGFDN